MKLFIYCSGGLGRKVCDLSRKINLIDERWDEISFIDDIRMENEYYNTKVYKFPQVLELKKIYDIEIIIASGEPYCRNEIYNKIKMEQISLAVIIHPDAIISPSAKLGEGIMMNSNVSLASDVKIEDNVILLENAIIGHDTVVASHSVISSLSFLGGRCNIGKRTYIAPGAIVKDRVNIDNDCIIGMGTIVLKDIEANSIMFGNPARKIADNVDHRVFKERNNND